MTTYSEPLYHGWAWPKLPNKKKIDYSKHYAKNFRNHFICVKCKRLIGTMKAVQQHHAEFHLKIEQLLSCGFCFKKFDQYWKLKRHANAKHLRNGEKPYQCGHCLNQYLYYSTAKRHIKTCSSKNKQQQEDKCIKKQKNHKKTENTE